MGGELLAELVAEAVAVPETDEVCEPEFVGLLLAVPVRLLDGVENGEGATVNDGVGVTQTGSAAHAAELQPHAALPQHAVSAQSVAPFMSLSMPSVQISAETAMLQPPTM